MKSIEQGLGVKTDLTQQQAGDKLKGIKSLASALAKSATNKLPSILSGADPNVQRIKDLEQEIDNLKRQN